MIDDLEPEALCLGRMVMLEKDIQAHELETPRAKSQDFAFFMPGLIDRSDAALSRDEIVNYAALVRKFHIQGNSLKAIMQSGLDESLDKFASTLKENEGGTLVLTTRGNIAATERSADALKEAFGSTRKDAERQTFIIPTDKITAVSALGHAVSEGSPEPVLLLRIQTGQEQPTTYFAGPGQTAEVESPGSWYQFKFEDINVGLLTPVVQA